jgi:acyl transferase domain-containing protein
VPVEPFRYDLQASAHSLLTVSADELSCGKEHSRVNEPEFSQTLCTAVQIALVDLIENVGVQPTTVVGHSSGEIAAA